MVKVKNKGEDRREKNRWRRRDVAKKRRLEMGVRTREKLEFLNWAKIPRMK